MTFDDERATDQDAAFAAELAELAQSIHPDADFKAALEKQLRAMATDSAFSQLHEQSRMGESTMNRTLRLSSGWRSVAAAAAALVIVAAVTLAVPPLRSFAQELLDVLFNRAASDTEVFETPVVLQMQTTPIAATFQVERPSLTVEEVEAQAGFDVLVPAYLPSGYTLEDVYYDEGGKLVSQFYNHDGIGFNIVQMQAEAAEPMEVGATAEIIEVQIGDVTGQYVEGFWTLDSTRDGETVQLEGQSWNSDFPFSQLRWQVGDTVFWMMTTLGQKSDLPLSEWEAIAESLR